MDRTNEPSGIPDGLPYSPEERAIFEYEVAGRRRLADPMALVRRVQAAQRDLGVSLDHAQKRVRVLSEAGEAVELGADMMADYHEALGEIASIAFAAFGVKSIEEDPGSGWTEAEALDTLYGFFSWMERTREDFPTTPSSPTSTASGPTVSDGATATASPTGPSSGSGPTATASATSGRRRRSSG